MEKKRRCRVWLPILDKHETPKRPKRSSAGRMAGVASTYPKSSREYMSAKKDGPVPEREMKGGVKERDYGGEGEV